MYCGRQCTLPSLMIANTTAANCPVIWLSFLHYVLVLSESLAITDAQV